MRTAVRSRGNACFSWTREILLGPFTACRTRKGERARTNLPQQTIATDGHVDRSAQRETATDSSRRVLRGSLGCPAEGKGPRRSVWWGYPAAGLGRDQILRYRAVAG